MNKNIKKAHLFRLLFTALWDISDIIYSISNNFWHFCHPRSILDLSKVIFRLKKLSTTFEKFTIQKSSMLLAACPWGFWFLREFNNDDEVKFATDVCSNEIWSTWSWYEMIVYSIKKKISSFNSTHHIKPRRGHLNRFKNMGKCL